MKKATLISNLDSRIRLNPGLIDRGTDHGAMDEDEINEIYPDSILDTADGEGILEYVNPIAGFNASYYGLETSLRIWKQGRTVHFSGTFKNGNGLTIYSTPIFNIVNDEFNAVGTQIIIARTSDNIVAGFSVSGGVISLVGSIITNKTFNLTGFWATAE